MTFLKMFAIIAILQILPFSIVYGQNVDELVIEGDTVFIMDRAFAELVAERFDSLVVLKRFQEQADSLIANFQHAISVRSSMIQNQQSRIDNLNHENELLYQQIKSFQRTDNISETLRKQLKAETRKRKFWQYSTAGVAIAGIITSIYLIAR
jgi:hypothetical protein